ncbi:hypothetical protein SSX86_031757 [Deinandra increscens subsp. villosa]|uniref:Uncharacterized protein n=1 Tax=Deinandra increscens subsp. villosa TaxID=3103831 RepID=A0AAP0GIJ2_9ASTR
MEDNDLELGSGDVDNIQLLLAHHVDKESSYRNRISPSIYMVPSRLRDLSPSSFEPRLVSIGPLHREDVNVQAFEGHKSVYLIKLMSRIYIYSKEEVWKTCMQKADYWKNEIKACYDWPKNKNYSDAEIAEMMVIDACFILEFTYQLVHGREEDCSLNMMQLVSVLADLVLLENQIPLFFLNEIYHCTISKFTSHVSLIRLIRALLYGKIRSIFLSETLEININNVSISTADHILSLLHQCFMPPDNIEKVQMGIRIHSATDLDMAGVNFKPSSENSTWVMGIEMKQYHRFPYNPTLTMPVLQVHDSTEFILRNLIAYEQSFKPRMYFTSYVVALDMLVNSPKDVAKLVDSRVLTNMMSSNEEAATMINSLGKNVLVDYTYYEQEWEKVNKYYNGYWPKNIASLKSTYFRSPWSIIALIAGIILFVLQVVQTIFTIMPSGNK